MKILHVASLRSACENPGVATQMEWEKAAARRLGFQWDVELWTNDDLGSSSIHRRRPSSSASVLRRRLDTYRRVRDAVTSYDVVLVRYAPLDFFGGLFPAGAVGNVWPVFHTNTGAYLDSSFRGLGRAVSRVDDVLGSRILRHAAGIIGVTGEILKKEAARLSYMGVNQVVYPNGLYLEDWSLPPVDRRGQTLEIAFIASRFYSWNGLESLLASIAFSRNRIGWRLHLVGSLSAEQTNFIEEHDLQSVVVVHGRMAGSDLQRFLRQIDLTLGAFELDAVGITEACTLKVRESLGAGIGVYSGHRDSALPASFQYYRVGPPNIDAILEFASTLRTASRSEIKAAARSHIDKEQLVARLYEELAGV